MKTLSTLCRIDFLAACLLLVDVVDPFIFQVVIDRILLFRRAASLAVVTVALAAASLFQIGFEALSGLFGVLTANGFKREFGSGNFDHPLRFPLRHFRKWPVAKTYRPRRRNRHDPDCLITPFLLSGQTTQKAAQDRDLAEPDLIFSPRPPANRVPLPG